MNFASPRKRALEGTRALRAASSEKKNRALAAAERLLGTEAPAILRANSKDVAAARGQKGQTPAFLDRLLLTPARIDGMRESLRQVARLEDPVGEIVEAKTLANGLQVRRVRSPLGVIFMIFESRPNVAVEAFSLALKAGNAVILRGGRESARTTGALYRVLGAALAEAGLPPGCLWGITDPDRAIVRELLGQPAWIDVVVPRGGEGLIDFVTKTSAIPVIKNDRGLCHVYVHEDADLAMAARIVVNAKTQRPGVCNAMETLLVHEARAGAFLPKLFGELKGVEWFCCPQSRKILGARAARLATKTSFDTEYLDLRMNCRVVKSLDEAIAHVERHGSRHSESIVTRSEAAARRFQVEIDAAAVYWNASTRFTDGFELGLGGELGISTQKLHARGPVGLKELTSVRWVMDGTGQTRSG